ncbi:MAG: NAD(P)/FAD-dependent oxidoreductase [Bacillota bacterium]
MSVYDLIIIGAGPAGAAAALTAARQGLSVLVLEQNHFPRHKVCTGCLSNKSLQCLDELGLGLPSDLLRGQVTGVTLWGAASNRRSTPEERQVGVMIDRHSFDQWLMQRAATLGAVFRDGEPVRELEQRSDHVVVRTSQDCLVGRWVIGADGVGGPTARLAGIRKHWSWWELGMTWSAFLSRRTASDHAVLALCNLPTAWGWVFPRHDGVHIGVGGAQFLGQALQRGYERWVRSYGETSDVMATGPHPVRYPVPAGGFRRRVSSGRVMLAGDAAGLADPFAGEGIHLALASGRSAANCIRHGWDGSAQHAYQQWVDGLLPELRLALWLSLAMGKRGPLVGRALCRTDWAVQALAGWMAGEKSYGELIKESLAFHL